MNRISDPWRLLQLEILKRRRLIQVNRKQAMKRLSKTLRDQRGFTLIELLVVISILGILAAVVTMSMVGITKVAQERAAATEEQTVQTAYDTMLADMGVPSGSECQNAVTGKPGTNAMSDPAPQGASGGPLVTGAWSSTPTHSPVALSPHYVREDKTHGTYHCDPNGKIVQDSYTP